MKMEESNFSVKVEESNILMEESSLVAEEKTKESINEKVTNLREGIKRLKFQLARLENLGEVPSIPAIEITFKNNDLADKYKTSIEKFLDTLLTEEEKKTVSFRILEEKIESVESQLVGNLFCIDTAMDEDCAPTSSDIPYYRTVSSEVLLPSNDKDDENFDVEPIESTPSVQVTTCFNCLGNHHMRECRDRYDKSRVMRNKKNLMSFQGSNTRYHVDEKRKKGGGQVGRISTALQEALGLRPHQLPIYIYNMRVLGYPPGWLREAEVLSSGLNVYDSEGNAVANKDTEVPADGKSVQYNSDKFIEYPGFNCPAPEGVVDEWQILRMPPLQQHQQLSEAVKVFSKPSPAEPVKKRKVASSSNSETKKVKNGDSESSQNGDSRSCPETPVSSPAVTTDDSVDAFGASENSCDKNSAVTPNYISQTQTPQSSGSLSSTPGTAILDRGNPFKKLPDLAKFSQGITEHLPYENLPGAVGTFEKMRNVLSTVRQKLTYDD